MGEDKSVNELSVHGNKHPNWLGYERAFKTISIHISEHVYLQQHIQCRVNNISIRQVLSVVGEDKQDFFE